MVSEKAQWKAGTTVPAQGQGSPATGVPARAIQGVVTRYNPAPARVVSIQVSWGAGIPTPAQQ